MAVPRITKEELKDRLEGEAAGTRLVLIDARLKYPYEHSTLKLPGAIRLTPGQGDLPGLPQDRDVVVYDSDPDELVSAPIAAALIRQGYRAMALKGGIADWIAANYPTDTKEARRQTPPTPGSLKG